MEKGHKIQLKTITGYKSDKMIDKTTGVNTIVDLKSMN